MAKRFKIGQIVYLRDYSEILKAKIISSKNQQYRCYPGEHMVEYIRYKKKYQVFFSDEYIFKSEKETCISILKELEKSIDIAREDVLLSEAELDNFKKKYSKILKNENKNKKNA